MKRIIKLAAIAALAAAACTKAPDDQNYEPDGTLKRQGEVTLLASMENFSTKAVMPSSGYGIWKSGDEIAVRLDDGSFVNFALSGTGDTIRAFFKGEIPQGRTLGACAIYPASAINPANDGLVSANIPSEISDATFQGIMVASIGDSWEICFRHTLSCVSLTLSNFPPVGASIHLSEEGRSLSGDFVFEPSEVALVGITAPVGEGTLDYRLPKSSSKLNLNFFLPVAEYRNLSVEIFDKDGRSISCQPVLQAAFIAERASMKSLEKTLEDVEIVSDFITLNGVSWCKGNLQRNSSAVLEGWQAGWELAPEQWFSYNYELKANGSYSYDPAAATQMRFDLDEGHCNHFNFGGIEDPYTNATGSFAAPSGDFSISGKLFTDRECRNQTTDFGAAKYGDLAFWASCGQYRLPTLEEIESLKECDIQYGHILAPDGMKVWGLLFTEPADPQSPQFNSIDSEISSEQLENGLFLPCAGRRADSSVTVISFRTQGCYWTGGAVDKSFVASQSWASKAEGAEYEYSDILEFTQSGRSYGHVKGYAYDRRAGFCIRPVLN